MIQLHNQLGVVPVDQFGKLSIARDDGVIRHAYLPYSRLAARLNISVPGDNQAHFTFGQLGVVFEV